MQQFVPFVVENWYLWLAFVVVLGMIIHYETSGMVAGIPLLSPQEAVRKMNQQQAVVIDIRDQSSFQAGHILSAWHIPQPELEKKIKKLHKYKRKPIIIVCQNGQKSPQFASLLRKQGFEQLFSLQGGMRAWREAELPLVKM